MTLIDSTSRAALLSTPPPSLDLSPLPPGTRIVLEVPKPSGGFECVTPGLSQFMDALAPVLAARLGMWWQRDGAGGAPGPKPPMPAGTPFAPEARCVPTETGLNPLLSAPQAPAPNEAGLARLHEAEAARRTCVHCGRPKTQTAKGRWMCSPCLGASIEASWARRKRGAL